MLSKLEGFDKEGGKNLRKIVLRQKVHELLNLRQFKNISWTKSCYTSKFLNFEE